MAINTELEDLYHADRKERKSMDDSVGDAIASLQEHDSQRLARVKEIEHTIDTSEIWNCHYIAYLFQHGETVDDYKKAHEYAKKAVDMGSTVTKWLYAATLDRWLVAQGKPQKFGTQFKISDGKKKLLPIDGTVTDAEREKFGVHQLDNEEKFYK